MEQATPDRWMLGDLELNWRLLLGTAQYPDRRILLDALAVDARIVGTHVPVVAQYTKAPVHRWVREHGAAAGCKTKDDRRSLGNDNAKATAKHIMDLGNRVMLAKVSYHRVTSWPTMFCVLWRFQIARPVSDRASLHQEELARVLVCVE